MTTGVQLALIKRHLQPLTSISATILTPVVVAITKERMRSLSVKTKKENVRCLPRRLLKLNLLKK